MNNIIIRIENLKNYLPHSEQVIAEHLLKHPGDAIRCSATELAKTCGTSKAAIVRFCKSLDFAGYRDLTMSMSESMSNNPETSLSSKNFDINAGDSILQIIQTVTTNNVRAIQDTMQLVDPDIILKTANALFGANKILVCGFGASRLVAQDLEEKLTRINLPCHSFADFTTQRTMSANMGESDVIIAISWSGATKELINTVRAAKEAGVRIISLTRFGNNKLSELSDFSLFASAPENQIRFGAMSSRIAQYNLVDILFSVIVSSHYEEVRPYLEKTHAALLKSKYIKQT